MAFDPVSGLLIHGGNTYNTYGLGGGYGGFQAPFGSQYNPIGQPLNSPFYAFNHPQAGVNALNMTLQGAIDANNLYNQQLYGPGGAFENAFGALAAAPGVALGAGQMVMDAAQMGGQQAIDAAQQNLAMIQGMGQDLNRDVSGRVDDSIQRAEQAAREFDEDNYAAIAAAAGSISEQTQQAMMDINGVGGMDMTPGMRAQMQEDVRMQGMKQLQGVIAPMQQQQQQISAQLGMNVAAMMQQGAGLVSNTGLGVMGQVNAAGQGVTAANQFAANLSTSAAGQAAQMQVAANQAQIQGYQSLAQSIAAAPPQFVNFFDTFLQGNFMFESGMFGYNTPTSVADDFYGMFG